LDLYTQKLKAGLSAAIVNRANCNLILIRKNEGCIPLLVSNHCIEGHAIICLRLEIQERATVSRRFLQGKRGSRIDGSEVVFKSRMLFLITTPLLAKARTVIANNRILTTLRRRV